MLFSIDPETKTATSVAAATFSGLSLRERYDIQEWVLKTPSLLGEDLLVVSTEFAGFDRTAERLDVLAVDRNGKLVVIELKRTAIGTAAELQAIRYAAFCSTFSLEDVSELLGRYLQMRGEEQITPGEARARIVDFVGNPSFQALDDKPRIILAAQEFPPEITATVMWLRSFQVDVSCIRLTPYSLGDRLVLDSSVLIPLAEAQAFLIRRARKDVEQAAPEDAPANADTFIERADHGIRGLVQRLRAWLVTRADIREGVFKTLISYRAVSDNAWVTWIELTRREIRVALPPEADLVGLDFIPTQYGWNKVVVRNDNELDRVIELLSIEYGVRYTTLKLHEAEPWNGRDFYVSFGVGAHRTWEDALRYEFISAGQGRWYSRTLETLEPGHRIFVNIPQTGYVGVGIVKERAVPVGEFQVEVDGVSVPILAANHNAPNMDENANDMEKSEYLVRVEWIATLPVRDAYWEKGMFANQNSVCRLTHTFTRESLLQHFGLPD